MSLAFLDLIELEPSLQSTFGWCAVVGLLGLLLARWKWWSALVTVPFAILCSMRWELLALGREVVHRRAAGPDALYTYVSEGLVIVLIGVGIVWNRWAFHGRQAEAAPVCQAGAPGGLDLASKS